MKPAPFIYEAPDSLDGALHTLAQHGDEAKILAGGQSLIPTMNFRLAQPAVLVDLNPVSSLDYIRRGGDGSLHLGSMTRQRRAERDGLVAEAAPLLAAALPFIAHPQIRNRGTIGGSLAHADPAAELPAVMVACNARFRVRSQQGERWVAAGDFFQGLFAVDLAPDEILVEIVLPPWPAGTGWSFLEVARRQGDYALVGVAAAVTLDDEARCTAARLVYFSVGDRPVDAQEASATLIGQPVTAEAIQAAADIAAEREIDPTHDIHASVGYQRHLTRVLTGRVLREALTRVT